MITFNIQVQPDRDERFDSLSLDLFLNALDLTVDVSKGFDEVPYINYFFDTLSPKEIWKALSKLIEQEQGLKMTSIVICTGESGWDDYLLLHHFDEAQELDKLS